MLPKLVKKGVLCVAFAAAVGVGVHMDNRNPYVSKPAATAFDYSQPASQVPIDMRYVYTRAQEAVNYEVENVRYDNALKKGTMTKSDHDWQVNDNNHQIAVLRSEFIGTPRLYTFDNVFLGALKQKGITPPATPPQLQQQGKPGPGPKASS